MKTQKFIPAIPVLLVLALISGCGKPQEPQAGSPQSPTGRETNSEARQAVSLADSQTTNAPVGAGMTRFDAKSGSGMKVRIEGTSTIHDWQVEGPLIGGFMEVGPGFPAEPGQTVTPGKVPARVEAFIPVRSLKSVEKDGSPYSDKMNEIMFDKLKSSTNPRIIYRLSELELKEAAKAKDAPYVFDAKGELVVAGATNKISMPVSVMPLGDRKIKVAGSTSVKMTDFGVQPPVLAGLLSTGDSVTLRFEWMVQQKSAPAATASK